MDERTWEVAATLLRRCLSPSDNRYDPGPRVQWEGGGYDCEPMVVSEEEEALLRELWERPWCYECERFLEPGESMWRVGSTVRCDPHWQEYKARTEARGRTVVEEFD